MKDFNYRAIGVARKTQFGQWVKLLQSKDPRTALFALMVLADYCPDLCTDTGLRHDMTTVVDKINIINKDAMADSDQVLELSIVVDDKGMLKLNRELKNIRTNETKLLNEHNEVSP
jgi:hypothetical protein